MSSRKGEESESERNTHTDRGFGIASEYLSEVIELMVAGSGPDSVPQPLTSRYCSAVSALMFDGMLPLK